MKQYMKNNLPLVIIALAGVIAALIAVAGRMGVEAKDKTYDIVLDYDELVAMSEQSEYDLEYWLSEFKSMGIDKVGLEEESISSLVRDRLLDIDSQLVARLEDDRGWRENYPERFLSLIEGRGLDEYDVIVTAYDREGFEFLSAALAERLENELFLVFADGDGGYIWLDGTLSSTLYDAAYRQYNPPSSQFSSVQLASGSVLEYVNLGLWTARVEQLEAAGMTIIPRTMSYDGYNGAKYAESVLAGYRALSTLPPYIITGGKALIGSDLGDQNQALYDFIMENDVALGLIETTSQLKNIEQNGLNEMVEMTNYSAVRVFSVWEYIQMRYKYYGYEGAEEVQNSLFRAVSERNVRVVYYKPVKDGDNSSRYITDPEVYRDMFGGLYARLERQGMSLGTASPMEYYTVPLYLKILMAFGSVAAAVMLLRTVFRLKKRTYLICFAIGVICVVGAFYAAPNLSALIASFAAAVVWPCLAVSFVVQYCRGLSDKPPATLPRIVLTGLVMVVLTVLISLVGSFMTAGPLSEIEFMLEQSVFRGVKLAQILPMAFFVLAFMCWFGLGREKSKPGSLEPRDITDILKLKIEVWMLLIAGILAVAGYFYIDRTGNTGNTTPTNIELLFRNFLELTLIARPRSKEFLIAFPCIMLFVYAASHRYRFFSFIFGLVSVIGLVSVVNTFMHLRTPVYLSLARTGYSLVFGLALGVLYVLIFHLCCKLWRRAERYIVGAKDV